MKIKSYLFLIIFFFIQNFSVAIAKPRCDLFYEAVYSQDLYPRDEDIDMYSDDKNIGINLLSSYNNEEKKGFPSKNKDGYYIVGKVIKESFATNNMNDLDKIHVGDVILSINEKDLRNNYDELEHGIFISDKYKNNEKIKFKLLRILPNKNKKIIEIETTNTLSSFQEPYTDVYIDNIEVKEKDGRFIATVTHDFSEDMNDVFNITNIAHKYLVQAIDKKGEENFVGKYPSKKEIEKDEFYTFECPFTEDKWTKTNSRIPAYFLKWNNLIFEHLNKKKAQYFINPGFEQIDGQKKKTSNVSFRGSTTLEIKNDFNLKSFPFDRQNLYLSLQADRSLESYRVGYSYWTIERLNEFKEKNNINGWNITEAKLNYKIKQYPEFSDMSFDSLNIQLTIDRKSGYYLFKIIFPIILILMICWSAVWIDPKEIESRLTITIVCLLSLIAYNFVIDSDLPKLEYLTIMDYIILISYVYAAIPNFLSIYSFQLMKKNKRLAEKYEVYEKRYGLPSYILIIFLIIIINASSAPEHTNSLFTWASMRN